MAGFDHVPNGSDEQENAETVRRNTRYGLILFCIYLALYGGFVFLNAFAPKKMEMEMFAGMNLAIVYGFVLILAAFLLALVYGWLCRDDVSNAKFPGWHAGDRVIASNDDRLVAAGYMNEIFKLLDRGWPDVHLNHTGQPPVCRNNLITDPNLVQQQ